MKRRLVFRYSLLLASVAILAIGVLPTAGCPNIIPPTGEQARLTVLFTAEDFLAPGGEFFAKARVVPLGEIESLVVTDDSMSRTRKTTATLPLPDCRGKQAIKKRT